MIWTWVSWFIAWISHPQCCNLRNSSQSRLKMLSPSQHMWTPFLPPQKNHRPCKISFFFFQPSVAQLWKPQIMERSTMSLQSGCLDSCVDLKNVLLPFNQLRHTRAGERSHLSYNYVFGETTGTYCRLLWGSIAATNVQNDRVAFVLEEKLSQACQSKSNECTRPTEKQWEGAEKAPLLSYLLGAVVFGLMVTRSKDQGKNSPLF